MERGFDHREDVPSTSADDVSSRVALAGNKDNVARLALWASLRIFHGHVSIASNSRRIPSTSPSSPACNCTRALRVSIYGRNTAAL
jgi:hypothetical protein